jgi:hypothetical protein
MLLALVDQRLEHLALGAEPEAVIDELGVARHDLVLEMHGAAVERDALDAAVRRQQDRAAGRLVDAARLHADEAVLDQVQAADAIVVAQAVERVRSGGDRRSPSIATGIAGFEVDGDEGRLRPERPPEKSCAGGHIRALLETGSSSTFPSDEE